MLLGTRMTNNEPSAITDLDVVARYDATDPNYVVKDSSNRISALLDKSKRLALGNELITNAADREFTSDTGFWLKASDTNISDGLFNINSATGATSNTISSTSFLVVGKIYLITFEIKNYIRGSVSIRAGHLSTVKTFSGNGIYTQYSIQNGNTYPYITGMSGFIGSIDNVSIKEVLGNHITQTDTTKMPIHTNRYNLLTYSEDFSNAVWSKANSTIIPNSTSSPNNSSMAYKMIDNTINHVHHIAQSISANMGSIYVMSGYFKKAEYNYVRFWEDVQTGKQCYFDLNNGIAYNVNANWANIEPIGNGWYRCSASFTATTTGNLGFRICLTPNGTTNVFIGNGESGIYIWGAQLEQSNFAGKYQRINDANNYNTNGFEYYAQFDGIDDYLKSLPFTLNQPTSIYSCLKQNSWTDGNTFYDGYTVNTARLRQHELIGRLRQYTGIGFNNTTKNTIGTFDNIYSLFNGAISANKLNNLLKIVSEDGVLSISGFTLAAHGGNLSNSNISVKEVIIKRIATDESDTIFNYFKNKHNVQY